MKKIDINCLVGHYPYRKIRKNSFENLCQLHKAHAIQSGFVASLDSIYYNDPLEGDKDLYNILQGTPYHLVGTINPLLPAFIEDLAVCVEQLQAKAIRIYPTYHNYDLDHPAFLQLCEALQRLGIPLLVCARLEDERLEYLACPKPMDIQKLEDVTKAYPQLSIVLLSFRKEELSSVASTIQNSNSILFDTSGIKNNLFALDAAIKEFGKNKLVFGSQWPLYCFTSTWLKVEKAEFSQEIKNTIYSLAQNLL